MNGNSSQPNSRKPGTVTSTRNKGNSFTVVPPTQLEFQRTSAEAGSHNDAQYVRAALTEAIRTSGKSRAQIADEMTYLVGRKITERMLNGYTAESQEDYLFPAELTRAFCTATNDIGLIRCIAELHRHHIIDEHEVELLELGRAYQLRTEADAQMEMLQRRLGGRPR